MSKAELQDRLLVLLADETSVFPDYLHSLTAIDMVPMVAPVNRVRVVAANLVALRTRGLVWRCGGPGSGQWCITRNGLAEARAITETETPNA